MQAPSLMRSCPWDCEIAVPMCRHFAETAVFFSASRDTLTVTLTYMHDECMLIMKRGGGFRNVVDMCRSSGHPIC